MNSIEVYQPRNHTLDQSSSLKDDLAAVGFFGDLPHMALEMGFERTGDLYPKGTMWRVYDRPNHEVPNFENPATVVHSTLALHQDGALHQYGDGYTHAILRSSLVPYPPEVFTGDLDVFTKHYIKRPRLLGFPSKVLTKGSTHIAVMGCGIAVGAAIGYLVSGGDTDIAGYSALIGETILTPTTVSLWWLSERYAKGQISALDQYFSGYGARDALVHEWSHVVQVAVQTEIFQALQQTEAGLAPGQFLGKIYGQLPPTLLTQRLAEVAKVKYPTQGVTTVTGDALPKLVEIAQILQTV